MLKFLAEAAMIAAIALEGEDPRLSLSLVYSSLKITMVDLVAFFFFSFFGI